MNQRSPILARLTRLEAAMLKHTCDCTSCMDGGIPTWGFRFSEEETPPPQQCRSCGRVLPITHLVTYRIVEAPQHKEDGACAPS